MTRCGNCFFTDVTSDFGSEGETLSYEPYNLTVKMSSNELSSNGFPKEKSLVGHEARGESNGELDKLN